MGSTAEKEAPPPEARAPRGVLRLMAAILVAMALLAIYSNVQKARRAQIETVTIVPAESPSATPTP